MKEDMKRGGYSKEDEYFHKLNKELIEKRRKQLDEKRKAQKDRSMEPYWMRCPKCGAALKEIDLLGINVDQCGGCNGVFFDSGELETVLRSKEPQGFLAKVRKMI